MFTTRPAGLVRVECACGREMPAIGSPLANHFKRAQLARIDLRDAKEPASHLPAHLMALHTAHRSLPKLKSLSASQDPPRRTFSSTQWGHCVLSEIAWLSGLGIKRAPMLAGPRLYGGLSRSLSSVLVSNAGNPQKKIPADGNARVRF